MAMALSRNNAELAHKRSVLVLPISKREQDLKIIGDIVHKIMLTRLRSVAKCSLPRSSRSFADNLLGHSPMAQPGGTALHENRHIPSIHEAKVSGVWQATSAKRDKLAELKLEAADGDLDAMATDEQIQELDLVDGLTVIAKEHYQLRHLTFSSDDEKTSKNNDIMEWLQDMASSQPNEMHSVQAEELIQRIQVGVTQRLTRTVQDERLTLSKYVHEFYDATNVQNYNPDDRDATDAFLQEAFDDAVSRFQLQCTRAAAQQFSWDVYTKPTDAGIDRAAALYGSSVTNRGTLSKEKLLTVLAEGASLKSCWELMVKENDGLLDQEEMNQVCLQVLKTSQTSLKDLMHDALGDPSSRRDKRKNHRLIKDFDKTLQQHFENELELPHRLRCIYSWANKGHQSNKVDSVLVEEDGGGIATGVMGRKRYVELHPKISLDEFREVSNALTNNHAHSPTPHVHNQVQSIHLPEIDEPAVEYLKSYRNDLLVKQGKGRQNRELLRDCSMFFAGVCAVDFVILSL